MRIARRGMLIALAYACLIPTADAQLGDFLKKLSPSDISQSVKAVSSATDSSKSDQDGKADPTNAKLSSSLKTGNALNAPQDKDGKRRGGDIIPDRQCMKPQEKFNIFEKAADYGGAEAQARLQALIQSDFSYDALSPDDRAMLKFIAQTTIWVPVEVENRIVSIGGFFGSKGNGGTPELEMKRENIEKRVERIKATLNDFPTDIKVRIDPAQADGAYAKFGGEIIISNDFTEQMDEHPAGGDFVLAHELSHVYKRHPIKKLQFELVSSSEGWKLAHKLLARATGNSSTNPIADATFFAVDGPKIIGVIKTLHLSFSREQELEADACAAIWLKNIGDEPAPAWKDFVAHYAATDKVATTEYGSTHPPTEERAANFQTRLAGGRGANGSEAGKRGAGKKSASAGSKDDPAAPDGKSR